MRISERRSDVCSSDLDGGQAGVNEAPGDVALEVEEEMARPLGGTEEVGVARVPLQEGGGKLRPDLVGALGDRRADAGDDPPGFRAECRHGGAGGLVQDRTSAV